MYSIKTDLGVSGNGTIDKDLLVNGNAVLKGDLQVDGTVTFANATFTQITVTGTANLADIASTGTASLTDVNVSGNTVLGDAATDSLTVNSTSTFVAPVTLQNNITQSTGTASFKDTSVDALTVAGESTLNGDLTMGAGTTATLKSTVTDALTVNNDATVGGTLDVTGKTTLQDVEINGTLSGAYTIDTGNFANIKVTALSDLNNVSIKGATTLTGNVTGNTSTISVNRFNMQGSTAIIEFAYNDPARPSDTKSSIEPYQISTNKFVSKDLESAAATIGVVGGTTGLRALGKATIDYVDIQGNSTIGTAQPQLKVAGNSVLQDTTVRNLTITGAVSGLSFTDLNVTTLNVSGASTLAGVTLSGNITGANTSIAKFSTFNVAAGTGGNNGIIQFEYNDAGRPSDTKSSVEPYKIATSDLVADKAVFKSANVGDVGGVSAGLHALGKATIDYLSIAGNSTIGTAQPQLQVAGASVLQDTTVHDLTITGAVSGLSFTDLDVSTLNVSGASTLQGVTVAGNITGANTSIAKFSTFTVSDGTAGNHGIIQFDYNDSARPSDIKSSIEPYKVSTNDVAAKNVVTENATVGNVGGTAGLTALGASTMDYVHIQGNSTIGTAQPQLKVDGKSILGDVDFTGVVTGLTVDVSGQDLTPNSVVATAAVKGDTLESTTTTTVGTNLTVGGTADVTGNTTIGGTLGVTGSVTAAAGTFSGDVKVENNTITVKDLVVTGTTTGVTAEANVDGLNIAPNSVAATTSVTSATADVTGALTAGSISTGGNASVTGTLNVTGQTTIADLDAENIVVSTIKNVGLSDLKTVTATVLTVPSITGNTTFANDVTITGTLTPASIDLSTTAVDAASVTTTGNVNVGGDLVVSGTVDLSAADVSVKSITATEASTIPTLASTTATIGTVNAGDVTATGAISAANMASTGTVSAGNVQSTTIQAAAGGTGTVTVASDLVAAKNLTVTGILTPTGGLDLSAVDVDAQSITTSAGATIGGNLSVAGTVDLSGADVTALSFVSSDVSKTNTFPTLASTTATITSGTFGTLTSTGTTSLSSTTATGLTVSGVTNLGVTNASSVTATGVVSGASFTSAGTTVEISKSTNVTGDFHASGTLTAGAIDLSTTDVTVKSLDSLGNAHVTGDLTVDGQFDLSATNLQAASLTSTGLTKVGTTLEVVGASTLSTVSTSGLATLNSAEVTTTLKVTGISTLAGVAATGLNVSGATALSTLSTSGLATLNSASITTSLGVTGTSTLGVLNATATSVSTLASSGKATLNSLEVTNATVVKGDLTVEGTLLPQGGLDLSGADIEANSLTLAAGATIATTLGVTGNTTVGGTLTSTGAGRFGSVTSDAGLVVTTGNISVPAGTITTSGQGTFGSVASANGLSVASGNASIATGNLIVTAGNISQNGAATTTASFKKTSTTNLHVGTLVWDEVKYIAEVGGGVHISGDLDVDGTINAQINLTGRDISPRSITTSQSVSVGTTLEVTGQSTMASAVIGSVSTEDNNNLQIYGNTVCTGDFTVQGLIIGTLDQSTSDINVKSVTSTTFVKGATLESTGAATLGGNTTVGGTLGVTGATTVGAKLTVSAGGAAVTGGLTTDTLSTSSTITSGGKVTVSAGGLAVTGGSTTDTLTATGLSTLAAVNATNVSASGTLAVTGTSTFTGKGTFVNLESTGLITAKDLTVTGTLTADIADIVTTSVTTSKYFVKSTNSVASTATWTPDGTSNVYNVDVTADTTIGLVPYTVGLAGSWFIYVTQDATGHAVSFAAGYEKIGDSVVNTTANSVSICQVVYCGRGTKLDVFIAQRNV